MMKTEIRPSSRDLHPPTPGDLSLSLLDGITSDEIYTYTKQPSSCAANFFVRVNGEGRTTTKAPPRRGDPTTLSEHGYWDFDRGNSVTIELESQEISKFERNLSEADTTKSVYEGWESKTPHDTVLSREKDTSAQGAEPISENRPNVERVVDRVGRVKQAIEEVETIPQPEFNQGNSTAVEGSTGSGYEATDDFVITGILSNKSSRLFPISDKSSPPFYISDKLLRETAKAIHLLLIPVYRRRRRLKPEKKESPTNFKDSLRSPKVQSSQKARYVNPDLEVANSQNWRQIRTQNPLYHFAIFSDDVWTIDTTIMSAKAILKLPTHIAGRPVILNYLPSMIGSFPYYPDPVNTPIDPTKDIDDGTLRFLFEQYPGARAACVYLNKTLVLLYDGKFNRRTEFRKRPRKFGGLDVDHAPFNQRYTTGPVVNDSRLRGSQLDNNEDLRVEIGSNGFGLTYSQNGVNKVKWDGLRVGVRLKNIDNPDCEVLTMTAHSLLKSVEDLYEDQDQEESEDHPWYNPAKFLNINKTNYKINYHDDEFGIIHSHYEVEPESTSDLGGYQNMLRHDLVLIGESDKASPSMRFPIFRNSHGIPIEMEWADLENEDFKTQEMVLLGFNIQLHAEGSQQKKEANTSSQPRQGGAQRKYTGTASQQGRAVVTHEDYKDKTLGLNEKGVMSLVELNGVVEGRGYECRVGSKGPLSKDPKFQDRFRDLSYFQRSILWRPDIERLRWDDDQSDDIEESSERSSGLLSIEGASGCPLAFKTQRYGKTVYKIFGFQNSEHVLKDDDLGLKQEKWAAEALIGNFHTYHSLCLPEKLTKEWVIVWKLPTPKPQDQDPPGVGAGDSDIEMRDSDMHGIEVHGIEMHDNGRHDIDTSPSRTEKATKHHRRTTTSGISKSRPETAHSRKQRLQRIPQSALQDALAEKASQSKNPQV
ncbi:hypothetical protein TWF106_008187 [Orbilia oligospora]|uniref:Uncharacterized protein n=1 Tax=Orbilia oligospora TaxID=2813651 RepID=A0A7C8UN60_ORBOL|nr:hypothetical protein TWF788_001264 [Orbilia oligospora]KAF3196441.1 hypothetical protein TWF679_005215 [Orbilia oligospora]KAF3216788.1 hypothetical protein TWF106_008187 [Orbilia oligospora]